MLDQLRNALATAQADVNAAGMGKPRPKRPTRHYIFERSTFGRNRPRLTVEITGSRRPDLTYECTDATYDRFVRLANSGDYQVEIMDSDHGIAWQMYRKAE